MGLLQKFGVLVVGCCSVLFACNNETSTSTPKTTNWNKRAVDTALPDSLARGTSYLSVYSQIYSRSEERTHDLTATVSIRNISQQDTVYVLRSAYYDTGGKLVRTYFQEPVWVAPLETVEIVISEVDNEGGTGANFIFDWAVAPGEPEPMFEAVMISTSGQQGISFTTRGTRIR